MFVLKLFRVAAPEQRYIRNIYFLTGTECPVMSLEEKQRAIRRIQGALEEKILVEVIALKTPGFPFFDFTRFYADVFQTDKELKATPEEFAQSALRLEQLVPFLRKKDSYPRVVARLPFELWEGITCSVNVYSRIYERKPPAPFYVDAESHTPLQSQSQLVCANTGQVLDPTDVRRYYLFGGEKINVTVEERQALTKYSWAENKTGHIRLLGFKPAALLKREHGIKKSYFLYPNEEVLDGTGISGSSKLLAALIASMDNNGVCAVVRYILRPGTPPRLGYLLPQFEEVTPEPEETQLTPPGLHLIPAPFADDLRTRTLPSTGVASPVEPKLGQAGPIHTMMALIKEWRLPMFDPRHIPNPALQFYYARLEALCLNEPEPRSVTDATLAVKRNAVVDELLDEYKTLVSQLVKITPEEEKRPAMERTTALGRGKRHSAVQHTTRTMRDLARQRQLDTLLLTDLKGYLEKKKLPVSGKKSLLIQRIEDFLSRTPTELDSSSEKEEEQNDAKRQRSKPA